MDDISFVENQFIKADSLIGEGRVSEAKELLEEILNENPDFGKAHNHLGWIYATKLSNYEKGEYHYKLAIKFDPKYPASYLNYTYLLVDIAKFDDAKKLIDTALTQVEGADKASYYSELARIYEFERDFIQAYQLYKKSSELAFNPTYIENMKTNMKRVKDKMSTFEKIKLTFK